MHDIFEKLVSNEQALTLVKRLHPVDLMKSLVHVADLLPSEAAEVVLSLRREGLGAYSIETNKQYPVPPTRKAPRVDDKPTEENYTSIIPKYDFQRHEFPPDPRGEPSEWPFDDMTVQTIDPKNKTPKRPLMNSKEVQPEKTKVKKIVFRKPAMPDFTQSNSDGGGGLHQKAGSHASNNSTPSGGSSWFRQGVRGLSRAYKEFDPPPKAIKIKSKAELPEEKDEELPGNEVEWLKDPPVGSAVPQLGKSVTDPVGRLSKAGYRGYGKK